MQYFGVHFISFDAEKNCNFNQVWYTLNLTQMYY